MIINWAIIILPLIFLQLLVQIVALVDLIRRDTTLVLGGNKLVWGVIILLLAMLGPILYFVIGRKSYS